MSKGDLLALLPLVITALSIMVIMLAIAIKRNHRLTFALTVVGLVAALLALLPASALAPRLIAGFLLIDSFSLFYLALILSAGLAVALLSFSYWQERTYQREEFYMLLLLALLGSGTIVLSSHYVSFFLGLELLSISLYALAGYQHRQPLSIEAGMKYLIMGAVSSAFLLFGIALIYAEKGSLSFFSGEGLICDTSLGLLAVAGVGMLMVGIAFKLALVPFHMWTADVYQGAPLPVSAFIATISKGAVFAFLLRYFSLIDLYSNGPLLLVFALIAALSMFTGNLLALFQNNLKRLLAYSSIAHMGYLLVALLAGGPLAALAVSYYLVGYFITALGAFAVLTVLSRQERDADDLADVRGLAWRQPWLAAVLTLMLLSLAGIPLTVGFVGKFQVLAAGIGSGLWWLVLLLAAGSVIGLYYYLRVIVVVFAKATDQTVTQKLQPQSLPLLGSVVLVVLTLLLVWLGVFPAPLINLIVNTVSRLF